VRDCVDSIVCDRKNKYERLRMFSGLSNFEKREQSI